MKGHLTGGRLGGRRAVVTGSGRGIGRAIAEHFAVEGASVVVTARTVTEIDAVADRIRSRGGDAHAVACDITDDIAVAELMALSTDMLGGPADVLVNNAGVYRPRRFLDHDLDDWRHLLDVNVVATVRVTMAFLPAMLELDRSRVINIASIAGKKGSFGQAAYNASKHAQIGLTRCLAIEYGHTPLRVNAICPGFTRTDLIDVDELAAVYDKSPDRAWADIEAASTIGRTVTLEEISGLAVYLASDASDGVNGQSLVVDGGVVFP
jgi:NAD(P)-dependent dehydrogenase (short-subunit alcohol dehydrogenase family)